MSISRFIKSTNFEDYFPSLFFSFTFRFLTQIETSGDQQETSKNHDDSSFFSFSHNIFFVLVATDCSKNSSTNIHFTASKATNKK